MKTSDGAACPIDAISGIFGYSMTPPVLQYIRLVNQVASHDQIEVSEASIAGRSAYKRA